MTDGPTTETNPTTARAPRRRAAGRPAGPPAEVAPAVAQAPTTAAAQSTSSTAVVAVVATTGGRATRPPRASRAAKAVDAVAASDLVGVPATEAAPPARAGRSARAVQGSDSTESSEAADSGVALKPTTTASARGARGSRRTAGSVAEPTPELTSPDSADVRGESAVIVSNAPHAGTDAPSAQAQPTGRGRARKAAAGVPTFSAVPEATPAGAPEGTSAGLLMFQAPSAEAVPSRRRAAPARTSKAAPPIVTDDAPEVDELDEDEADLLDAAEGEGVDAESDESDAPRRRRRRGGRGRRRRTGGEFDGPEGDADTDSEGDSDSDSDSEGASASASDSPEGSRRPKRGRTAARSAEAAGADEESDDEESEEDGDDSAGSSRRRRRRRRRTGADVGTGDGDTAENDPPNTVTRVREPRAKSSSNSEITSVRGSTRLEAKKQRRREGRETGRRRPSILTEAEFLARREAVDRVMIVRQREDRTQIAVLEDGVLVEHYVNRNTGASMIGNVYLGKVQNVLPSMEAAFVDIGRGRNAVLYAGEVNWDAAGLDGQPKRIEAALKSGDSVLTQVSKDPLGHKGARLTAQISLPGRFLVYVPEGSMTGISRKLPDTERSRLKSILRQVVPERAGVIVRTAAEGASEEELRRDVERLAAQWAEIEAKIATSSDGGPVLLHGEPDLAIKVVRDIFNEDFARLVVEGDEAWATIESYVAGVAPDLADRIHKWVGPGDLFAVHRIDEQLSKALDRKVYLPSGGSLVIDRTEAMTVVDVNTGKFTGNGGNLEETVTRNNLEAAEEIVRQLRLRDIGGIVVIDFIDMVLENNRDLVLRRLLECLGRDRTKHQVAEVTSLGLVQMTRKRIGQGLLEVFSETCDACQGRGYHVHSEPVAAKASDVESEGPATRSRRRKGEGDSGGESSGGSETGKGKGRGRSKSASSTPDIEPRVIDPAVSAAMEKIHAAAAKAAREAAGDVAVDSTSSTSAAAEPAVEPSSGDESAPLAAPRRLRAPRKAVRRAGPASTPEESSSTSGEADVTGDTVG